MEPSPRRRRALSTILAIVLAAESVSAVAAAGVTTRTRLDRAASALPAPAAPIAATLGTGAVDQVTLATMAEARRILVRAQAVNAALRDEADGLLPSPGSRFAEVVAAAKAKDQDATRERSTKAASKDKAASNARATTRRSGRNHVWIPSLGINRAVSWFSCDRKRPPDNYVYRWGCAGSNNVYLLGHAYSVFKPLHDAYVRGRLRKGLKAYYADARGRVHTFRVRWWKVTAPTTAASWAWAAQRRPSMTLQTCVGRNSAYRLMVRLVEVS